jgi:hypothetical protein
LRKHGDVVVERRFEGIDGRIAVSGHDVRTTPAG